MLIGNTSWGMYRFRADLIKHFVSQNFRVVVVAPFDQYSSLLTDLGSEVVSLKVDRKGTNPISDIFYTIKLTKIILSNKPDVVLSYTIKPVLYGTLAAWITGVPQRIGITTGLGNTFNSNNLINKITKILYKVCLRFSTQVWFLNSDDQEIFLVNKLVAKQKAFVLPGEGVDVHEYRPREEIPKKMTFTLISRMLWDKGVGLFVEAAHEVKKKFPEATFLVVGPVDTDNPEGIPREQLEKWNNEGVIQYLGPTDDVRSVLLKTSCLVHPTYYKEGLPRVLMEASSMGIPSITTDIPGCRDVVVNGFNGLLVPPKDFQALALAMVKFIELDPHESDQLSANGVRRVTENFSSELITSVYMKKLFYS